MDSWYNIVKSYDDPKSKDHGTLSQRTASILLIYHSFGTDYSGGIAKFFNELSARCKDCPNILTNSNKISSVLKRMAQDELIILSKEATVKAGTRKYYVINPQILQSPIKDSKTYTKRDGSPFIIPLEIIEDFLEWMAIKQAGPIDKEHQKKLDEQLRSARHERTDDIFEKIFLKASLTYISFLDMIYSNAALRDLLRQSKNKQSILESLIADYICELDPIRKDRETFVYISDFIGIKDQNALLCLKVQDIWTGFARISQDNFLDVDESDQKPRLLEIPRYRRWR